MTSHYYGHSIRYLQGDEGLAGAACSCGAWKTGRPDKMIGGSISAALDELWRDHCADADEGLPPFIVEREWLDPDFHLRRRHPMACIQPRRHPYGADAFEIVDRRNRVLIFPNRDAALAWQLTDVEPVPPYHLPVTTVGQPAVLAFSYKNYKGEDTERRAIFFGMQFGSTEWHPKPQWLLNAFDLDKEVVRLFAMKDMTNVRPGRLEPPPESCDLPSIREI